MDRAELFDDRGDGALHGVLVRYIDTPEGHVIGAQFPDLRLEQPRLGSLGVKVEDRDLDALRHISLHGGLTQAGGAAGNNCYFSCKIHKNAPSSPVRNCAC